MNADSAYAKFTEDPGYFDIVVTDFDMTGMSGLQLSRAIHQLRTMLPIILTTGTPDALDVKELKESGCCDVIKKPFGPEKLSEGILRALRGEIKDKIRHEGHEEREGFHTNFSGSSRAAPLS